MFVTPLIYRNSKHTPMNPSTDDIEPALIPISSRAGNEITAEADGLYMGRVLRNAVVYVDSAGSDVPTAGTKASPYKTLDYALTRILADAGNSFQYKVTVALKAGQTFVIGARYKLTGNFTITFYGDPTFGDFNSPWVNGTTDPAWMENLSRPIIMCDGFKDPATNLWASTGFDTEYGLDMKGVTVALADRPNPVPPAQDYGPSDFILGKGEVNLEGVVVDKTDPNSLFGFVGIKSRTVLTLNTFATQFLSAGVRLDDSATAEQLADRQYYIKFYLDYAGNNSRNILMTADALNSSNGSGMLNLSWTDTNKDLVVGTEYCLETFPQLANLSYGLRNYIYGIRRDQQSRPLNITSPRLFSVVAATIAFSTFLYGMCSPVLGGVIAV